MPEIEADAGILRQALLNLAKNAVQAMPDGGTLTIAVRADQGRPRRDSRLRIPASAFRRRTWRKIFDLYFTTKQTGTGIGLSLVYRTVQLHNGDIDVESTPGVGTTFVIKMPKAGPALASSPMPSLRASRTRSTADPRRLRRPVRTA